MNKKIISFGIICMLYFSGFVFVDITVKSQINKDDKLNFGYVMETAMNGEELIDYTNSYLGGKDDFVLGEIIITFKESVNVNKISEYRSHKIQRRIPKLNLAIVEIEKGTELEFVEQINTDIEKGIEKKVFCAEPNYIGILAGNPNDPLYTDSSFASWGLNLVDCPSAWDQFGYGRSSDENDGVCIAFLDDGIDISHEDLADHYKPGGIDWVEDYWGDTIYDDELPTPKNDFEEHGTFCAGIASGIINNNKGIAGVCNCSIYSERICGHHWWMGRNKKGILMSDLIDAILHASQKDYVDIISMSLKIRHSNNLKAACLLASNTYNKILVAASGNNNDDQVSYPAAYDTVIAVGAVSMDEPDKRWKSTYSVGSNYGENLDIMAPGGPFYSITLDGYEIFYKTRTSYSCAFVSGVVALMKSANSGASNAEIEQALFSSADDLYPDKPWWWPFWKTWNPEGWDKWTGHGRVNVFEALQGVTS